jgi:biotin-(acetyl-CoA carboxylase) ligase
MPASSLFLETGRRLRREDVLVAILDEIETTLSPGAFTHAGDDMRSLCETLGHTICIDRGVDVITGTAQTIAADGTLLLETPEGMQTVYTTEVVRTWSPEVGQ